MAVAILAANRIQDQQDFGSTPGAGNDGYAITWDNGAGEFVLSSVAAPVSSVFGRTGAVVAVTGDYTVAQVTNAAAVNAANTFTAAQKINVNSTTAFFVEQDGVKDNVLVVDTTNGRVGINNAGVSNNIFIVESPGSTTATSSLIAKSALGNQFLVRDDGGVVIGSTATSQTISGQYSSGRCDFRLYSTANTSNYFGFYVNGGAAGSAYGEFGFLNVGTGQGASLNFDTRIGVAPYRFFVKPNGAASFNAMDIFATGDVGIGTSGADPSIKLCAVANNAVTNAITNICGLVHNSSGTPDVGFGAGLAFRLESSTNEAQDAARLVALWDVATHASRSAALQILISGSGGEVNAATFDDDATAGNTRFLVYDVDNGQLERVSVGAADSGGTGYKVLRIAN